MAKEAGVDVSLVSRVLNNDERAACRPETRERILAVAARLHYRPHMAARGLKTARTMAFGMVVPDLSNVVYSAIAHGAESAAATAGYQLLVASGLAGSRLRELEGRIDGVLIGVATSETIGPEDFGGSMPKVLVNRREDWGIPSVVVDDEAGAALATRHLIELGHTRLAHVSGPHVADTARRRLQGFISAARASGIEVGATAIVEGGYDEPSGFTATRSLLQLRPRPTGIFVANIRGAMGALAAIHSSGLRVPADVSIIGMHDVPLAAYLTPPLDTVRMPLEEMGRRAIDTLQFVIAGGEAEDSMVADLPELVLRSSTGPPRRSGR